MTFIVGLLSFIGGFMAGAIIKEISIKKNW
jgi:hypothetical protein